MNKQPQGKVRLFQAADEGKPIHGWKPLLAGTPLLGLGNPKGWLVPHVVVQKLSNADNGATDNGFKDLYDQLLIVENPGAIVVCKKEEKVGMVANFRFTAERLPDLQSADYVARLVQQNKLEEVLLSLGQSKWELPRGLSPLGSESDLTKYILATAKVESSEEGGFEITNARICGRVNANSTFFAHAQYVVSADITRIDKNRPEQLELIGKVRLFDKREIRQMIDSGEFDDGLSLAALAVASFAL